MSQFSIIFYLSITIIGVSYGYLESVAANVGGTEDVSVTQTEPSALVAFKCGYRNRYFSKDGPGNWISDTDPNAGCLKGKLDILKYCKKAYPDLRITNIVEASRDYEIKNWCKLEGQPCKWTFKTKPYRCVVGKFESEALLVPERCHFGHVDDQKLCKDFDYWNRTARRECETRRPRAHVVKSFAMLEPCGLDMFSGVEFVCCPRDSASAATTESPEEPTIDLKVKVKLDSDKNKAQTSDDDEDDSSDEDDDDDEDSREDGYNATTHKPNVGQSVRKRVLTVAIPDPDTATTSASVKNDDDSESDEDSATIDDAYFRIADPDREYAVYRAALDRVEKRHKEKVAEAIRKLSEAETKYQRNNEHDTTRLDEMKTEFRDTMSALEKSHHEERHRVDEVHQLRISAALNERKRQAVKAYRRALTSTDGRISHDDVLRALRAYVRAEEKDRTHWLNRYRFLLRSDTTEADVVKRELTKTLRNIDLRINGTVEISRDVPGVLEKIKPAILEFWQRLRDENTPGTVPDTLTWIGDSNNGERLLDEYEKQSREHVRPEQHTHTENSEVTTESDVRSPANARKPVTVDVWNGHKRVEHEELKQAHAFALKETIQHEMAIKEETVLPLNENHHAYVVVAVGAVTMLMVLVVGVVLLRKRYSARGRGFMAVDHVTPEERHVSGMQVNGYENPTYTYFEKAA